MNPFKRNSRSTAGGLRRGVYACALSVLLLPAGAAAQVQTSRYIYDDDGRLRAVVAPGGEAAVYDYDSAGNFTAVRRLGADALELLAFAPRSGLPGTRVVFYGVGFGAGVTSVTFGGGVAGTLVGFNSTTVTALVPAGAATGPVTINTARGTLTTATPFVLQGITLDPREVSVPDGLSVQFSANVIAPGDDQEVSWRVNGVEGGGDTSGRITDEGLYTAPLDPPEDFDVSVQAVSLTFPALVGTAVVHVRVAKDFRFTLSPGVSIGKGEGFTGASVFSPGISVGKGAGFRNAGVFGPGVALTKGPVISAVSPGSVARGSDGVVTLGGSNFGGATGVRLFNPDGSETFGVTVSNLSVGGNGSSITVRLTVQAGATAGRKVVVVTTPTAHSVRSDVVVNTIEITAP